MKSLFFSVRMRCPTLRLTVGRGRSGNLELGAVIRGRLVGDLTRPPLHHGADLPGHKFRAAKAQLFALGLLA